VTDRNRSLEDMVSPTSAEAPKSCSRRCLTGSAQITTLRPAKVIARLAMKVDFRSPGEWVRHDEKAHRTVRVESGYIDADAWRSHGHDQPGAVFDEL